MAITHLYFRPLKQVSDINPFPPLPAILLLLINTNVLRRLNRIVSGCRLKYKLRRGEEYYRGGNVIGTWSPIKTNNMDSGFPSDIERMKSRFWPPELTTVL